MEENKEKATEMVEEEQMSAPLSAEVEQALKEVVEEEIDKMLAAKKSKKHKIKLWKIIGQIITGKYNPDEVENAFTMATLTSTLLDLAAIVLFCGSLGSCAGAILKLIQVQWTAETIATNITIIVTTVVVFMLGMLISLLLRVLALGVQKEKDKHYVAAIFSGMTGFVALIISLVALFK